MGVAAILTRWPGPFKQTFIPHPSDTGTEPILRSLHMKFEFNWTSGFREDEKMFENVDWRATDGQRATGSLVYCLLTHFAIFLILQICTFFFQDLSYTLF